jgi:hypothetical protein
LIENPHASIYQKTKAPTVAAGAFFILGFVTISCRLPPQKSGDIQMVVPMWRGGNTGRPAMDVQTLRSGSASIFRHWVVAGHLLAYRALRLPLG